MTSYRLYTLSQHNGHILSVGEFEANDEAAAIEGARLSEGPNPLELWCGHKKVFRIESADPAARMLQRWQEGRQQAGGR